MNSKTEQALQGFLGADEQICWHSATKDFALLAQDAKNKIVAKWIGTAVFAVAGTLFAFSKYAGDTNAILRILIGVVVIAALLATSPLMEKRTLMKQEYWITNRRVLMMGADRVFHSITFSEIDAFYEWKGRADGDCLIIGSVLLQDAEKMLRWRACHPKGPQGNVANEKVVGVVFYCVSNLQGAIDQLTEHGVKQG